MRLDDFLLELWMDYVAMTPRARKVQHALVEAGETIVNDHVALRTLDIPPLNLHMLEQHFLNLGYRRFEAYRFEEKKLRAWSYLPPSPEYPRLFFSEVQTAQLSAPAQAILHALCDPIDPERVKQPHVFWDGRQWPMPSWEAYQTLAAESEQAAWLAVIGLRAHHFALSVNHLQRYREMETLLSFVESLGIPLDDVGGRVLGSPQQGLERGSTLADHLELTFAGGDVHSVPTCSYQFTKRYAGPDGQLYQGFVADVAAHRI